MSKERRWGGMLECTRLGILLLLDGKSDDGNDDGDNDDSRCWQHCSVDSSARQCQVVDHGLPIQTTDKGGSPVVEGGDGVRMAGETAVAQRTNGQFTRSRQTLASSFSRPRSSMAVLLATDRWMA
jgi:hypothetical protein